MGWGRGEGQAGQGRGGESPERARRERGEHAECERRTMDGHPDWRAASLDSRTDGKDPPDMLHDFTYVPGFTCVVRG